MYYPCLFQQFFSSKGKRKKAQQEYAERFIQKGFAGIGQTTHYCILGRVPCDNDWKNPVRSGRKQRYSQWLCAVGCLAFFVSVQLRFFEDSRVCLAWLRKDKQKVFC